MSEIILENLKKEIPCKWRVQSFSKHKPQAQCVAYIDARQAMDLLDEVVGAENWQSDFKIVGNIMLAGVGIYINNQWVWKWDTGVESNIEKEKGEISDSFKRACVKWGIGRIIYYKGIKYAKASEAKTQTNYPYVIDEQGNRVWNITKHLNEKKGSKPSNTKETRPALYTEIKKSLETLGYKPKGMKEATKIIRKLTGIDFVVDNYPAIQEKLVEIIFKQK